MLAFNTAAGPAFSTTAPSTVQDPLVPTLLQRLSWGAVIAGALLALATEIVFYLGGLTLGLAAIDPTTNTGDGANNAATAGVILWNAVSTLIALFLGGWVAAYLAGIPTILDGVIHGLLAWSLLTIITLIGLTVGGGRIVSGTASLIDRAFNLVGVVTGAAATGVGKAADALTGSNQQTIHVNVDGADGRSPGVPQMLVQALGVAGGTAMAPEARQRLEEEYNKAIDRMPEVDSAQDLVNMTLSTIEEQARSLLQTAGVSPEYAAEQASEEMQDIRSTARYAVRNPDEATHTLRLAINRLLRRADDVTRDVDRQSVVDLVTEYTELNEDEARETVDSWENAYYTAVEEFESARDTAWQKIQEARHAAEERVNELREEAEAQAERTVRDATNNLAKVAAGIMLTLVIGALAAGLGGSLGAPEELLLLDIPAVETTVDFLR